MLSTNALVIAGTALSFAARGAQRPNLATLVSAGATLLVVAASVVFASLALIAPRVWVPRWVNLSPEQQLRGAVIELWKAAYIHQVRYRKLRTATRCLPVAIGFLLVTITLTMAAY